MLGATLAPYALSLCLHAASIAPVMPLPQQAPAVESFGASPQDVTTLLEPILAETKVPAIAVAVVSVDGPPTLLALGACGVRDASKEGDQQSPVTRDDLWHLGSCTKAFTATLCGVLVEAGELRWNSTVGELLGRDVVDMHPGWKDVTLDELLHHRGGAPKSGTKENWQAAWNCHAQPSVCRQVYLANLLAEAPAQARGTFEYSNQGYAMAGRMCEVATGKTWEDLVRTRVCEPLGITSLGFGIPSAHRPDRAPKGHRESGTPNDVDNPPAIAPAGTMHMTLTDWARFIAFHTAASPDPRVAISPSNFDRLHAIPEGTTPPAAMGWFGGERPWGGAILTHAGSNNSWHCVAWISPSRKFAVLATCNQGGSGASKATDAAAAAAIGWWQGWEADNKKRAAPRNDSGAPPAHSGS